MGSGLTGSLIAAILRKSSPTMKLTMWEKMGWFGGRTLTCRHPTSQLHVDMGAQYITRFLNHACLTRRSESTFTKLKDNLYDELLSNGIILPLHDEIEGAYEDPTKSILNYTTPKGFSSIVEHFLAQSKVDLFLDYNLHEVNLKINDTRKSDCRCTGNQSGLFDALILTMPTPELIELKGDLFHKINKDIWLSLSSIRYSPRYALGLFYKENILATTWSSKYFETEGDNNNAIIRYASWQRGHGEKNGCTLLLHSSVEFATRHQETGQEKVKTEMMQRLDKIVPGLPSPIHCHLVYWKCARVNRVPNYHDTPGCLVLSLDPLVVATGDGLCDSNFESCVKAAMVTAGRVLEYISNSPNNAMKHVT